MLYFPNGNVMTETKIPSANLKHCCVICASFIPVALNCGAASVSFMFIHQNESGFTILLYIILQPFCTYTMYRMSSEFMYKYSMCLNV